ncbi:MAG: hypothetical protein U0804_12605 [Gemmataceae bacterium]
MAVWRRRALALFPQLGRDLNRRDYSVYSLFIDLKPLLRAALDAGDEVFIRGVFGFAEWCALSPNKDLWNPAGVAFYEHLFDYPAYSDQMLLLLTSSVVFTHWPLWGALAPPDEWARVKPMLEEKRAAGERAYQARTKSRRPEPRAE